MGGYTISYVSDAREALLFIILEGYKAIYIDSYTSVNACVHIYV